jgi:hypothetical protein
LWTFFFTVKLEGFSPSIWVILECNYSQEKTSFLEVLKSAAAGRVGASSNYFGNRNGRGVRIDKADYYDRLLLATAELVKRKQEQSGKL